VVHTFLYKELNLSDTINIDLCLYLFKDIQKLYFGIDFVN